MNVYTRTGGLYTLHHRMRHRRTTPHKSTQLLDSSYCDELQARPPPSSDRSKSTSPIGSSVDAPTIPKCRSKPPKTRPFSPSERHPLSTFSPHSRCSSSTSIAPPSLAPPRPGGDLDSHHVRAIYAALDVSGVRGDGHEDGEELTRVRVKN